MKCPECGRETYVYDSRSTKGETWRRRRCDCGIRFTTRERPEPFTEEQMKRLRDRARELYHKRRRGEVDRDPR